MKMLDGNQATTQDRSVNEKAVFLNLIQKKKYLSFLLTFKNLERCFKIQSEIWVLCTSLFLFFLFLFFTKLVCLIFIFENIHFLVKKVIF